MTSQPSEERGGSSGFPGQERRRQRKCPSCGGSSMIRGCRLPGVQIQIVSHEGGRRSGLISLYSDVCMDCGLTSFYARRAEVEAQLKQIEADGTD